jgi:hypothetical protein
MLLHSPFHPSGVLVASLSVSGCIDDYSSMLAQAAGKDGAKDTEKPNGKAKSDKPNGTSTAKVDTSSNPKVTKSEKNKESTTTSTPEAAPVEGKEECWKVANDSPTANQSGQTIRHLRLRFSDSASHIGTLQADGG